MGIIIILGLGFTMMLIKDLEKELAKAFGKKGALERAKICGAQPGGAKDLIELSFHRDQPIGFRASWILELMFADRELLRNELHTFLDAYPKQKNLSCRRHFTKILMQVLNDKGFKEELRHFNWDDIIEATFEWLAGSPVAVQVNCLDILFKLKDKESWIKEELEDQINFFLRNGTAAMQSRGKRLLKKMK